jgi:phosphatidylserine/phosphatidylglycerophosphate/cardiolipin synthase-like enzyme
MTDLTQLLKDIQNPETSHVDMVKRRAKGTLQWFLEKDAKTHPIHNNNHLEFFMCGQEGFAAIERDIRAATSSIDLVLWGFDPGMELVRSGNVWPRGTTYGDLLTAKGREGVKVRLLVWYDGNIVEGQAKNLPDLGPMSGVPLRSILPSELVAPSTAGASRDKVMELRAEYCNAWWNAALHGGFRNVEVRLRKAHPLRVLMTERKYLPGAVDTLPEAVLIRNFATHHQKPVLIDYAPDKERRSKANTCGYVMGLNSVTDYWDTTSHEFNEPMREYSQEGAFWTKPWHRKPYRDYAIRVQGEALYNINENFVQGHQ